MKHFVINQLGTPQAPTPEAVKIYLNEFLMDARIISIPRPLRDVLVKGLIVPLRKSKSAEKYKSVWTTKGSPLAIHTENLRLKIQEKIGAHWKVHTAMRYGEPSLESVFKSINRENAQDEIYFLPLYPQYATATVASAEDELKRVVSQNKISNVIKQMQPFYREEWFIQAQAQIIKNNLDTNDFLLFSYHGIPVSQEKSAPFSYQQQCLETTRLLCEELGWPLENSQTVFQSRVGFAKWLEPSTEHATEKLARNGITSLKVVCPSFVADCLETIEEIGLELSETFLKNGGKEFKLIPCLNSSDDFAEGLISYLQESQYRALK